jgi:hypothetical protein
MASACEQEVEVRVVNLPALEKRLEELVTLFEGWSYPGTVSDLRDLLAFWRKNRELIYSNKNQQLTFILGSLAD